MAASHRPSQFKNVDDLLSWAPYHEGKSEAWWTEQHDMNKDIQARVRSLEKRVIYFSGFAAGAGALIGTGLAALFGN